jgi:hypothetical protein
VLPACKEAELQPSAGCLTVALQLKRGGACTTTSKRVFILILIFFVKYCMHHTLRVDCFATVFVEH